MILLKGHSDRAVQNHRHVTGATDTYWLNELVRYVRGQGLWDQFVFYPMMPKTNYGTGSQVRPLGGLTSNAMTLVNGPTWGASGLAFASSSSQYGTIADFLASETLTVFYRTTATDNVTTPQAFISQFDFGNDSRSWSFFQQGVIAGDPLIMARSSDGTAPAGVEQYSAKKTGLDTDNTFVAQWVDGGGRSLWLNKSVQSLSLLAGSAQTSRYDSSAHVTLNCQLNNGTPAVFADQTTHALCFLTGTVTDTQRETITDMINEL